MNELTIIAELGAALDDELRGPAPGLRRDVVSQLGRLDHRHPRPRSRGGWRSWPRPARRIAITGALVVVLTAGLFAASTLQLWGDSAAASAEAAALLRHAATAARHEQDLGPSADQYIYVQSEETAATLTGNNSGAITSIKLQTDLREIWQSVSGVGTGLLREQPQTAAGRPSAAWQATQLPGCRNGIASRDSGWTGPAGRCVPQPGYQAGLPTTTAAMLGYLYRNSHGQNPPDVQAFITAGDLIRESYVQPAALAALFRAIARIPGVTVVRRAANAAGQPGTGVQQVFRGISQQLIFNPHTYAFIGERQVVVAAGAGLPVGTVLDSTAVLAIAAVDHVGQLPG